MITLDLYDYETHNEDYTAFSSKEEHEKMLDYCRTHELELENFHLAKGDGAFFGYPIEYIDFCNMVFIELFAGTVDILEMMNFHKEVRLRAKLWEEKNLLVYMGKLHRRYYGYFIDEIRCIEEDIPDELLWNCYEHLWIDSEYLNGNVDKDTLLDLFSFNVDLVSQKEALKEHADTDGYITVYRGEASKSKSYESEAISWSLSKEKAQWFANRFSCEGTLYQASVHIDCVLAYLTSRSEDEVIFDSEIYAKDVKAL